VLKLGAERAGLAQTAFEVSGQLLRTQCKPQTHTVQLLVVFMKDVTSSWMIWREAASSAMSCAGWCRAVVSVISQMQSSKAVVCAA
jgi:hypothetical protein